MGLKPRDCINHSTPYLLKMKHTPKAKTFLEWLGLRNQVDWGNASWLGPIVATVLGLLLLVMLCSAILLLGDFLMAASLSGPYAEDEDGSAIRNIGLVLVALFGAPFLVWRSVVAARLAKTSDDSLFNEKITSFANQLAARRQVSRTIFHDEKEHVLTEWEDDLVARAAAIDGLEGLALERPTVTPRVVRLIANYIRGTFQCNSLERTEDLQVRATPRMDLQKSIDLIGRLLETATKEDSSNWRLDLTSCNLDGVNFARKYFRAVNFSKSRIEAAVLDFANFEAAIFYSCLLNHSTFSGTNLSGVCFDYAILNLPEPVAGGFIRSINMGNLKGATFVSADISALDYLGSPIEVSQTFGTRDTKTSPRLRPARPDPTFHQDAFLIKMIDDQTTLTDRQVKHKLELEKSGFQNWSPYSTNDGATGHLLSEFRKELEMYEWPFTNH